MNLIPGILFWTGALLTAGLLSAAEPMRIPQSAAPSLIDGNLSETCWKNALKTGPFRKLDGGTVREKTEGFLFADRENLYIGMKCYFSDYEAKSREIASAKNVFSIDRAEIFIDPGSSGNYQHIAVNAAGIQFFPGKQAEMQYGVQLNGDNWTLEARIPFRAIKVIGENFSKEWRINLARGNVPIKENTTWAPLTDGTFHQPDRFFCFSGIDVDLVDLAKQQIAANKGNFEITLDRILYNSQKNLRAVLDIRYVKSMKGFSVKAEIFSKAGESVLTKTIQPVFFKNTFTLPIADLKNGRYKLLLQLMDPKGKVLESGEKSFWKIPPKNSKQKNILTVQNHNLYLNGEFFFPIFARAYSGNLTPGVPDKSREDYCKWIRNFYQDDYRKVGYNCVEAGSLDISTETDFPYLRKFGGLEAWNISLWKTRQTKKISTEDIIDARACAGIYTILTPYYLQIHSRITDEMIDHWVSMMLKLREMKNILMWSMADETDGAIDDNKLRYQLYKEMDPDRLAWLNVINAVSQNKNSADVLSTDPYPIPNGKVSMVGAHADRLVQAYKDHPEKSYMLWLQIFGGEGSWTRPPTPEEMRVMAFIALNHGIKGIGWWGYQPKPRRVLPYQHPDTFEMQATVHARILELAPVYCLGKKTLQNVQNGIDVAVLEYQGKTYVSCANTRNEPVHAVIRIPGNSSGILSVKYEKREVTIQNGSITDLFKPYEVHLYEF